jgi:hypothetical protein
LDVAIGFVALFFLLSTVCAAINEGIANVLGWRAKTLEDAVRNLVGHPPVKEGWRALISGGWRRIGKLDKPPAESQPRKGDAGAEGAEPGPGVQPPKEIILDLFDHWRIKGLVRDPTSQWRRRARPSYLPPRAFSLALAETLARQSPSRGPQPDKSPWEQTDDEILERLKGALDELPEGQLRSLVQKAAVNAHESLEGFRAQVEHVFDDSMERASGWYKRKVQSVLLVLAAAVAIGLNVDTVRVATVLWNDQPLRTAVATRAAAQGTPEGAAAAIDDISQLQLPVGWGSNAPDNVLFAIPGWLITIAALNLGAPFWFDLLSRLGRLRGSGVPERPRSLNDSPGVVVSERAAGVVDSERAARRERSIVKGKAPSAGKRKPTVKRAGEPARREIDTDASREQLGSSARNEPKDI